MRRTAPWLFLLALPLLAIVIPSSTIVGIVTDGRDPVASAHVRWQGDATRVVTDAQGRFTLPAARDPHQRLTASKPGYRIASASSTEPRLTLIALPTDDRGEDTWVDPHPNVHAAANCANCHTEIYREWAGSAHALAARNPKFLSLYAGTTPTGKSAATWNARVEHPLGAGVCATCHVPTLSSPTLDYDPRAAAGVSASGIHCDYCHKIAAASPSPTRFGRDALRLLRPPGDEQLFFGPLPDAVRPGESFAAAPVFRESRYCAACHEGVIFGVHAYRTYSEWRESPASRRGQQCQSCHMAPTGTLTNIAPGKGGIPRDPSTLASHGFPGGQAPMLRRCLGVAVNARSTPRGLEVQVTIRAHDVGHRVPTGFVDRHLLLVVEPSGGRLLEGPRLPSGAGALAGQAGWLFGRQLAGTERSPIPFWLPVARETDTTLRPDDPDVRTFIFSPETPQVRVRLLYRRFWQAVADERGWTDNEIEVTTQIVRPSP